MEYFSRRPCLRLASANLSLVLAAFALSLPDKALAVVPTLVRTSSGKLFFDDFNRSSLGSGYTAEGMGTNGWSIAGNRLRYASTSGNGQACLRHAFSYNGEAIYDFTFKNNSNSVVAPRFAILKAAGPSGNHYLFDTDQGAGTVIYRITSGGNTTLLNQPLAYAVNVDYRTKIRSGAAGTGAIQAWRNEVLLGSGDDTAPLGSGNFSFQVGNFNSSGGTVEYDNLAIYKSTKLTVNGTYGSWALYQNDGTTPVGTCNTSSIIDYATVTSFPADYAAGSASQIKVFPAGITTCTGAPAAVYIGSSGNEIFGGDVFMFDPTGSDLTPPTRSNGQPSGTLPTWTTQTALTLTTDENATCRYTTETAGPGSGARTHKFSTTGTTSHSTQITGLTNGASYDYFVRCVDSDGNANLDDYPISFTVSAAGFQNQTLITGLNEPTAMAFVPDGRMLITQKGGKIWVVQPGATAVDPTPFLTLTNINSAIECGLVGLLLDRDFSTNGYFYVFYTGNTPLLDRVSRFTASGNQAISSSEVVIWQDDNTTTGTNYHRGGMLSYGPDGYLYVSVGDHNSPSIAQSLTNYYGKILRLRTDGTIPTDNPFYDGAGPNKDAIWLRGLRNPFRFYIHPVTGELLVGDVGATRVEEINRGVRGANYGWPQCEGVCAVAGMTNPIYSYPHNAINASITAGFIYQGAQFPPAYRGSFFFGDYAREWIKRLTFDSQGTVTSLLNFEPSDGSINPGGPTGNPVFLTEGPDGSLYYIDIGTLGNDGTVRKVSYFSGNQPPVAVASGSPASGNPPLLVQFSSAGSQDPEGKALTYLWEFGDGNTSREANPRYIYKSRGRFQVKLTVSDDSLSSAPDAFTITVGSPPIPAITSPGNGLIFVAGDIVFYSGEARDDEDGNLPESAFSWTILFHHDDHVHPVAGPITNVTSGTFPIPSSGHDFRGETSYELILTVRDSDNIESTTSVFIFPQKVNLTFNTSPANLNLQIDGVTITDSEVYDTLVGFTHLVNAPNQIFNGQSFGFSSWSDNGAQSHAITAPDIDQIYTAIFSPGASIARSASGNIFFDDFNRSSLGSGYTAEGMGTNGWSIVGNRLRYTSTSGNGQAYLRNAFIYNRGAIHDFTFKNNSNSVVAPRVAILKAAGASGNHYLFDISQGTGTAIYRVTSGGNTTLLNEPLAYAVNVDYRTKVRAGAAGTGTVQAWRNEVLLGSGNDTAPLGSGNFSFHVGNFNSGGTVEYDNLAIYKSTKLTVNGTYGSWALYQNDGTTPVGTCNTSSIVDYATITSFPADYAAGSASQIKVFPAGITNCTGPPAAVYTGSPGNEIFGGDVFTFTP